MQLAANVFRRQRRAEPRIAGVLSTKNYTEAGSTFASLKALSDVTIVLDDNSESSFPHRDECDEYLTLRNSAPWNDVGNRTLLLYRAFVHGCDWVVCMDDDVIFSHGFQTKNDVLALITDMRRRRQEICYWMLCDRHTAYHLGCLTSEARRQRVEKYVREDPANAFQADYSYMLNTDGLVVQAVPAADRAIIARKMRR
jgi:hypothetical protein